jgi:histidinol-phosphate phosphatase family protein
MEVGWSILTELSTEEKKPVIFLDRDGVINQCAPPHEYILNSGNFVFLPGVKKTIGQLNTLGFRVVIITNQRGIARGLLTWNQLNNIHVYMMNELNKDGAHVDAIYVCPHDNDECNCRKPQIGLFEQAEKDFEIDKSNSWMIGDSDTDVQAGQRYGIKTIKTTSLIDAVQYIVKEM